MAARRRGSASEPTNGLGPALSSPIINAAQAFLALLERAPPLPADALAKALDQIAVASHDVPRGRYASQSKRPPLETLIGTGPRFSDPLHYTVVNPLEGVDQQPYCGSMADDINDLGQTMREAIWRFEHNGRGDAHIFLRTLQQHWELHLRELSLFLYANRFRRPAKRRF